MALLVVATAILQEHPGVPLAPQRRFPGMGDQGILMCTTNASGVDGVGGYVFTEAEGGTVWL
eukprot:3620759-Pleurochrysis_carterae.AAC.1